MGDEGDPGGISMHQIMRHALALLGLILVAPSLNAAQSEQRVALVIGNAAYQQGALPTTANDAGLIAQTLQAAGFDVVGARDLDGDTLRHTLRDFMQKAAASGPDTVAMIYLAEIGRAPSELQSPCNLVCRLLLEKKKKNIFTLSLLKKKKQKNKKQNK